MITAMIEHRMTDEEFEIFLKNCPPVGFLAERDPNFNYGVVYDFRDGTYVVEFMGMFGAVAPGTKIKIFGGGIKTI